MKPAYKIGVFCVAIAITALLMIYVDRPLATYMHSVDQQHPGFINIFRDYTNLGQSKWYMWPCFAGAIICAILVRKSARPLEFRRRMQTIGLQLSYVFTMLALTGVVADILKVIIGRGRPVELERGQDAYFKIFTFSEPNWHSLPSGHSTTAATLACVLTHLWPQGRVLWIFIAFLLVLSRVMVDAHYLTDTLTGVALGCALTIWGTRAWDRRGMFHMKQRIFPIDN